MPPLVAERLASQLLSCPSGGGPVAVVEQLLAVQAQDARGFRLAVRSRSAGQPTVDDLEAALDEGRLVVSWLNRGTLHLVRTEDFWELHALTTPQLVSANTRRLRQEGVDPEQTERGIAVCAQTVAEGPRTRGELREALDAAGVPTARQALIHVLFAATLAGHLVRGPMRRLAGRAEQAFVAASAWVGPPPPLDRPAALARLARRYLVGHAPADARDLARWAGIALTDARAGFAALADETRTRDDGLVVLRDREPAASPMPPRLLGAFDPLLLGWTSRADIIGAHTTLVTDNGIFRPFVLIDGRAVATWGLAGGVVTVTALEPLATDVEPALQQEVSDVLRYLGLPQKPAVLRSANP